MIIAEGKSLAGKEDKLTDFSFRDPKCFEDLYAKELAYQKAKLAEMEAAQRVVPAQDCSHPEAAQ